jgi:hypothetical protein
MAKNSSASTENSRELPMYKIYKSIPELMLANFLAGIAWGVGSLIGGTVIVALIGFILARTLELPTINEFVDATLSEIQQTEEQSPE